MCLLGETAAVSLLSWSRQARPFDSDFCHVCSWTAEFRPGSRPPIKSYQQKQLELQAQGGAVLCLRCKSSKKN